MTSLWEALVVATTSPQCLSSCLNGISSSVREAMLDQSWRPTDNVFLMMDTANLGLEGRFLRAGVRSNVGRLAAGRQGSSQQSGLAVQQKAGGMVASSWPIS